MSERERKAVISGRKTQHRLLAAGQASGVTQAEAQAIDWHGAHRGPSDTAPLLWARRQNGTDRRTVVISSQIQAGDLCYPRTASLERVADEGALLIRQVAPERLQEISNVDCMRDMPLAEFRRTARPLDDYKAMVARLGRYQRRAWERREEHTTIHAMHVPPRAIFAVWWTLQHGTGSWDANPWVWVYTFERLNMPVEAATQLKFNKRLRAKKI